MHKITQSKVTRIANIIALALALWFVFSVISNARDLIQLEVKHAPATYALWGVLLLTLFSWYKQGKMFITIQVVTLTMLGTALLVWLLGLSVR